MTYSSFWYSNTSTPLPPGPIDIGNSLRFRGAQTLRRTFASNVSATRTVSFWAKKDVDNTVLQHVFAGDNTWSVEFDTAAGDFGRSNGIGIYAGTVHTMGTGSYSDPSAWYHIVATCNGTSAQLWVNGAEILDATLTQQVFATITIGALNNDGYYYEGYMSDVYFIDGQSLPPTAFGKYDNNNKWIPIQYKGTYGTNGFHLTFQPDSITQNSDGTINVADMSGLGNDFTGTGFDLTPPINYTFTNTTNDVFYSYQNENVGSNAPFTAGEDNYMYSGVDAPAGTYWQWEFAEPIPVGGELQLIWQGDSSYYGPNYVTVYYADGTDSGDQKHKGSNPAVSTYSTVDGALGKSITKVRLTSKAAALLLGGWCGMIIGGSKVTYGTDGDGVNYDLMEDSPTQNFQTFNPLPPANRSTLTDITAANLEAGIASNATTYQGGFRMGTVFAVPKTGKWMFGQYNYSNASNKRRYLGIWLSPSDSTEFNNENQPYPDQPGLLTMLRFGDKYQCGVSIDGTLNSYDIPDTQPENNTPHGCSVVAYDADTKNAWCGYVYPGQREIVWIQADGTVGGDPEAGTNPTYTLPEDDYWLRYHYCRYTDSSANVGVKAFILSDNSVTTSALVNSPEGFNWLNTQFLPTLQITDGTNEFRAVEGAGAGILPIAQGKVNGAYGATGFPQAVWMIKDIENANEWQIVTSPGGFTGNRIYSNNLSTTTSFLDDYPSSNAFDGSLSTYASTLSGAAITFAPTPAIPFTSKLEVYVDGNVSVTYDGTSTTPGYGAQAWYEIATGSGEISAAKPIVCSVTVSASNLYAIRVDGEILIDSNIIKAKQTPGLAYGDYVAPSGNSIAYCWNYHPEDVTKNGFEIVNYTGNFASATSNDRMIDHNLGKVPGMVWMFGQISSGTGSVIGTAYDVVPRAKMNLNVNSAQTGNYWTTANTTTQFQVGGTDNTFNADGVAYTAMLWSEIEGYSKFGSYTGNGATDDGTFVYTGFTPSFIMYKRTNSTGAWVIQDSTRSGYNPSDALLYPSSTEDEFVGGTTYALDFLSNGFKWRSNPTTGNASGGTYIYMAFASSPFGGANVEPANAALTRPNIPGVTTNSDGNSLRYKMTSQQLTAPAGQKCISSVETGTISMWMKFTEDNFWMIGNSASGNGGPGWQLVKDTGGSLKNYQSNFYYVVEGANDYIVDYNAWYHIVLQARSDKTLVYINGRLVNDNYVALQDYTTPTQIGLAITWANTAWGSDGYVSEVYGVYGQQLTAETFGEYDNNGVWVPRNSEDIIESIGGTAGFGANGYYLKMSPDYVQNNSDGAVLEDLSGNGNNFSMVGFNTTDPTSSSYDFMVDGPSQNFATLLENAGTGTNIAQYIDANLSAVSNSSTYGGAYSSICVPLSGKWYLEKQIGEFTMIGVQLASSIGTNTTGAEQTIGVDPSIVFRGLGNQPGICIDGVLNAGGTLDNDVFGYPNGANQLCRVMLDLDAATPTLSIEVNGVTASEELSAGLLVPGSELVFYFGFTALTTGQEVNFGQQPFQYPIPAGYKTLEVDNLPAVTIADGSDAFRALEAPGGGILPVAQGLNNDMYGSTGFPSGMWMIKDTVNANNWQLVTSVGGVSKTVTWPTNNTQLANYIPPSGNSVSYCWNYDAADPAKYGFQLITYTGDGQTEKLIDHDLGKVPQWIIVNPQFDVTPNNGYGPQYFDTLGTGNWIAGFYSSGGAIVDTANNVWRDGTFTTTQFGIGASEYVNDAGKDFIAAVFAEIPGYSSFGSYVGNSNADGPFIYTGFTPAFVLYKCTTAAQNWHIRDSVRNHYNPTDSALYPNSTNAQTTNSGNNVEFLSNGFKIANGDGDQNTTGQTYIYMAFASNPFGGSNVNEGTGALQRPKATPKEQGPLTTASNSLRFRATGLAGDGTPYLIKNDFATASSTTGALSYWYKPALDYSAVSQWQCSTFTIYLQNGSAPYNNVFYGTYELGDSSTGKQFKVQDPNAWYHFYIQCNGSNPARVWVNGVEQTITNSDTSVSLFNTGDNLYSSYWNAVPSSSWSADGYMTDATHVDGVAPPPTAFGGYDDNGNWVPRDYNGSYGANGFHLTFAADTIVSSDLSSDWRNQLYTYTPTSGTEDPTPAMLASTDKNFLAGAEPVKGFNGSNQSYTFAQASDAWLFRPDTPITGVTKIEVWNGTSESCWVNGVNTGTTGTALDFTTVYNGPAITLTTVSGLYPINYTPGANVQSGFSIFKINGRVLIDDSDTNYQSTTICLDQSGNANNWGVIGFDTNPNSSYYIQDFFTSGSPLDVNSTARNFTNPQNAFDGSLSTFETTTTSTDYVILRKEFTGVSSLRLYAQNGISEVYVNGVNTNTTGSENTWVTVPLSSTTVTSVACKATGTNNNNFLKAIEINGSILVENTGDYDLLADGPSTNYATYLPTYMGPGSTAPMGYFGANLKFGAASTYSGATNFFLPETGKYYCEMFFNGPADTGTAHGLGVATAGTFSPGDSNYSSSGTYDILLDDTVSFYRNTALSYSGNSGADGYSSTYVTLGMAIDCDAKKNYSSNLTTPPGFGPSYPPSNAFDGDLATFASPVGSQPGADITFAPVPTINFTSKLEVYVDANMQATWDGTTVGPPASIGWVEVATGSGEISAAKPILFTAASSYTNVYAIRVDGEILVDKEALVYMAVNNQWFDADNAIQAGGPTGGMSATFTLPAGEDYLVFTPQASGSTTNYQSFNAGQQAFKYTPPTGYVGMKATNLPAVTIPNGTEGFRAIIASGNDVLDVAQADSKNPDGYTGFPSGLWWIKDMVNANQHQLVDSVRGTTSNTAAITCPASNPEATTYLPPAGDSVAWCWNASDPATNGFNILTWTGDGVDGRTIATGLTSPAEFVIYTNITLANTGKNVYYKGAAPGTGMSLNTNTGEYAFGGGFVTVSGTNLVLNAGTSNISVVNALDDDYVGYAWTSIPGYSAFGSYTGNDSADGPFIYTGFKPAFIIGKSSTGTNNWWIQDSTRSPYNLSYEYLIPNTTQPEIIQPGSAGADIDFLSNGFKIRTSNAQWNSGTIIYAAFASNPFGGSNVNPTNAALTQVPVVQYKDGDYSVGGSALTTGTAFTHNGIQYPSNWRDILSHEYLTGIGATWALG